MMAGPAAILRPCEDKKKHWVSCSIPPVLEKRTGRAACSRTWLANVFCKRIVTNVSEGHTLLLGNWTILMTQWETAEQWKYKLILCHIQGC